ncbi:lasso peptide biosynthesis B2 protein [Chitinophaga sancti]|uniref:Lasso peptide biosynthesis B2 protein n=1 Tax=Chitinophaga sancti TaxID=1004 RepID=A0A1K1M7E2_9BACT|nr:lasso peptide biosynthesis B2 protein [Chitinophaga sancti]WQD64579.1 lasso peptide biosynthesis B2 protein [Chitinophaga sancti]WQG89797.1 lasso peptide biosynthesis B2 protein [Chitinophaga sancti]SFW19076.1 Transglutaminase-like superfamily protein [Chitinophaga sancti]
MKTTDLRMFTEAWIWLALARTMLLFLPFRKLAPILGKKTFPAQGEAEGLHYSKDRLRCIGTAIRRAGKRSPWRTECFEQALAGKLMLKARRMNSTVFFGVSKNMQKGNFNAHAWLQCGNHVVTGNKHLEQFTVIACFKS